MELLEKFIIFLNKTILKPYRDWRWNKLTKVQGEILTYENYEE